MTHACLPGTFKTALTETIRSLGGAEKVAEKLGVGRSTVDAWKNPLRRNLPGTEHLIEMEWLYANAFGSGPSPCMIHILATSRRAPLASHSPQRLLSLVFEARKRLDLLIESVFHANSDRHGLRVPDCPALERELAEVTAKLLAISP